MRPARAAMLEALVTALMVWISRRQQLGQAPRNRDERDRQLLGQYLRLVEAHYREHLSMEDFAARLNVPSLQLNQLCRALSGQTALQVLHQRLLLEARRNLIYTRMSIGQLSDSPGVHRPDVLCPLVQALEWADAQWISSVGAAGMKCGYLHLQPLLDVYVNLQSG